MGGGIEEMTKLFYFKIDGYVQIPAAKEHEVKAYLDELTEDVEYPKSWAPIKQKDIEVREVDPEIVLP